MKRVVVTGASGFLGINLLVELLKEKDIKILAVGRRRKVVPFLSKYVKDIDLSRLDEVSVDIRDRKKIEEIIKGADFVYHVAGYISLSPYRQKTLYQVNVEGTDNVMHASLKHGIERVVHTSSIAAVGYGSMERPWKEDDVWNFEGMHLPYHRTKREGEKIALSYAKEGLDVVVVNPGYIIGGLDPSGASNLIVKICIKTGMPFYPKRGGINVCYVKDVAKGHILAMKKGKKGERYILGGENVTYKRLLELICHYAKRPGPFIPLYESPVKIFSLIGSLLNRLFNNRFELLHPSFVSNLFIEHYVSSEKAKRELGYRISDIDIAIKEAVDWFSSIVVS